MIEPSWVDAAADMQLLHDYIDRAKIEDTVRAVTLRALLLEAEQPEKIRELLEPILGEFVVEMLKHQGITREVIVRWQKPKKLRKQRKK